jgi:hypothetical protein
MKQLIFFSILLSILTGCDHGFTKVPYPRPPDVLKQFEYYQGLAIYLANREDTTSSIIFLPSQGKTVDEDTLLERNAHSQILKGRFFQHEVFKDSGAFSATGNVTLISSIFNGNTLFFPNDNQRLSFRNVNFLGKVDVRRLSTCNLLLFKNCYIRGLLDFETQRYEAAPTYLSQNPRTMFSGEFSIQATSICSSPNFDNIGFDSTVSFAHSSFFCDSLKFSETYFKSAPDFTHVRLPKILIFHNVSTSHWTKPLDLRSCKLLEADSARLSKCTVKLSYGNRLNPGDLDGSKFIIPSDRFEIEFDKNFPGSQKTIFLEQLSSRCKEEGMIDSYQTWDILAKETYNNYKWQTIGPAINFLQRYLWFFGYSPVLLLYWLLAIFITFWILNYINIHWLVKTTYYDENLGRNFPLKNFFSSTLKPNLPYSTKTERIAYSFLFTAVIYFGFKINV